MSLCCGFEIVSVSRFVAFDRFFSFLSFNFQHRREKREKTNLNDFLSAGYYFRKIFAPFCSCVFELKNRGSELKASFVSIREH